MNFSLKFGLLLAALAWWSLASAEVSLEQPRIWQRARTVHAGQQILSFQSSYQKVAGRFNGNGAVQPLGREYARAVTWGQLLSNEASVQERAEMERYMLSRGASEEDVAANARYDVEREETGLRMDWAYGLMKRWMIGFDVPLVYRQTRVKTRTDVPSDLTQKVRLASERELANSGFDEIPDQRATWDWGDVSLLSQVSVYEGYKWQWAVQQVVRFPTARNPDLDSYIQGNDDSGQVDLGVTSLLDHRVRRWTLGAQLGYVVQLPDKMRARVSSSNEARRVDPKVSRDLGDYYFAAADGDCRLAKKWHLNLEYSYLNKFSDKFRGRSAEGEDYASFSKNTAQNLHQTRVGFQYQLGEESQRAGVESKWIAALGYSYPWIGRNSLNASRTSVDLISYF